MAVERTLAVVGAFALAGLVGLGVYRIVAPDEEERMQAPSADARTPEETSEPGPLLRRNVFEEPSSLARPFRDFVQSEYAEEPEAPQAPSVRPMMPLPLVGSVPPVTSMLPPPALGQGHGWEPQQEEPVEPEPEPKPEEPKPPLEVGVVITATVRGPDGMRALVEDKQTGGSQWVTQGDEAFGYRISRVTERGGLVEKGDRAYALQTGSGKAAQPTPSAPKPEPGEGTPPEGPASGEEAPSP